MPVMSRVEQAFCRSAPWRVFASRVVMPWAVRDAVVGGDVLDVGGGTGVMAEQLLRRYPAARLTVTDLDEAMIATARTRLARRRDVRVTIADVTRLPFDDESFDVVTSFLMLHHVIEWEAAVTQFARVLRPGGRLIGYDLDDTRLARFVHRVDGSPHRLIPAEALHAALETSGLAVESFHRHLGQLVRFTAVRRDSTVS